MVRIRKARPGDVPLILKFIRELARFEKLTHEVRATESLLWSTLFPRKPATPFAEVLIAEWNRKPAGFALYFGTYSTFLARPGLYLEDLYVRPAFRSKGIGRALLSHLAKLAIERGCGRLEWSVLNWNKRAIAFYKRLEAKPQSEWTVYRMTGESLKKLSITLPKQH